MSPDTIQRLDRLFAAVPVLVAGGPVAPFEVDAAEQRLGVEFSDDFREFVQRYGGAIVGSQPVFGLRKAEVMGDDTCSVVDVTERYRTDGWKPVTAWIVVSMDLAGNPIGITSTGEVWLSDHDAGKVVMIAPTFEVFLLQLLDSASNP